MGNPNIAPARTSLDIQPAETVAAIQASSAHHLRLAEGPMFFECEECQRQSQLKVSGLLSSTDARDQRREIRCTQCGSASVYALCTGTRTCSAKGKWVSVLYDEMNGGGSTKWRVHRFPRSSLEADSVGIPVAGHEHFDFDRDDPDVNLAGVFLKKSTCIAFQTCVICRRKRPSVAPAGTGGMGKGVGEVEGAVDLTSDADTSLQVSGKRQLSDDSEQPHAKKQNATSTLSLPSIVVGESVHPQAMNQEGKEPASTSACFGKAMQHTGKIATLFYQGENGENGTGSTLALHMACDVHSALDIVDGRLLL